MIEMLVDDPREGEGHPADAEALASPQSGSLIGRLICGLGSVRMILPISACVTFTY